MIFDDFVVCEGKVSVAGKEDPELVDALRFLLHGVRIWFAAYRVAVDQ